MHMGHQSRLGSLFVCWGSCLLFTAGCTGANQHAKSAIGSSEDVDQSQHEEQEPSWTPPVASEDAVQKAARPFTGYRSADGLALSEEELFTHLAAADAVCVGERHDSALDHYVQLRTLEAFAERRTLRGFELGLALEMVQSGSQYELTEYVGGRMTRAQFIEETDWFKTWGFPIQYYDPQLRFSSKASIHTFGLGVPSSLSHAVAHHGLGGLSESDQRQIPSLDLDNKQHRELFDSLMGSHPLPEEAELDHFYQAQVVWDEAMAKKGRSWLAEHQPLRKLILLAGVAHCHSTAIPARMQRESGLTVVNLIAVQGSPNTDPSDLLHSGYEYQIVFE